MTNLIPDLRFFDISEFDCKYSGRNEMSPGFLKRLDELRYRCGFPFVITSGYRDPEHPVERKKLSPGRHSEGIAADIRINSSHERYLILEHAMDMNFKGIGVHADFVHVDDRNDTAVLWLY